MLRLLQRWRMFLRFKRVRMIRRDHWSVSNEHPSSLLPRRVRRSRYGLESRHATTTSTSATARQICSCCSRRSKAGAMSRSRSAALRSIMPMSSKSSVISTSRTSKKFVLVQDNLNTHSPASLYEAFPPAEARRLVERFEWHYTPKHGSWLDMAESELGVLSAQCLDRRIPDKHTLIDEIAAWEHDRNINNTKSDWHFTSKDARIKLKHLYPSI